MTLTVLSVLIHFMILYWINTTGMTRPRVSPNNSSEDQMILSLDCFSLPPTFHRFGTYILPQKGTVLHTLWPDTRFSLHRHSFVPPVSGCSKVLQFRRFLTKLIQSWIATNSFFFPILTRMPSTRRAFVSSSWWYMNENIGFLIWTENALKEGANVKN